jgi:hypothetical protein
MEKSLLSATLRTAKIIFFGIFFQATVFSFWGLKYFITQEGPAQAPIAIYVMFSLMAFISFFYGLHFFKNYIKVKGTSFFKVEPRKLKESLLLIYAIQVLLIEFVAIIGILVSIFTQTAWLIYPFYILFLIGMFLSYPRIYWFEPHFSRLAKTGETL